MCRMAILASLVGLGICCSAHAGVFSSTDATHTLTLESVTGVAPDDFVVSSEFTLVAGGPIDSNASGEGATSASGTVRVGGMTVVDPFEVPSLRAGKSFVAELTAVAERFSSGTSEAYAAAAYRMTFENLSTVDATFALRYVSTVKTSVSGADTVLNTSNGGSRGYAFLSDDDDSMTAPFTLESHPVLPGPPIRAILTDEVIDTLIQGSNGASTGGRDEAFSFILAPGKSRSFTIEADVYARAVAAVPEPGSIVIWSAGLFLVARRRRKSC